MKYRCDLCAKEYAWPFDLKRHLKSKHWSPATMQQQTAGNEIHMDTSTSQIPQLNLPLCNNNANEQSSTSNNECSRDQAVFFRHPFTMIVSGPTCCGKTFWVKDVLRGRKISPLPQRIVWLYKRWQPLYDVVSSTVTPRVEFVRGIPDGLERDSYLNPNVRNLIVVDDLMSSASKDPRITDLFTEGSHHRNLSVIAINQNLYYSKDPTQRRNCSYLVLFKNPIDQSQVATLARQMYPENPQCFMSTFKAATSKPYGNLVIDLKPDTPDEHRLRSSVKPIDKARKTPDMIPDTSDEYTFRQNVDRPCETPRSPECSLQGTPIKGIERGSCLRSFDDSVMGDMPTCNDCGILFENEYDLKRHVLKGCWEREIDSLKNRLDRYERKRPRYDTDEDSDYDDESERKTFEALMNDVVENLESQRQTKLDDYEQRGMTNSEAEEKVESKMSSEYVKLFLKHYAHLLKQIVRLRRGRVHVKIMKDVDDFLARDYNDTRAINTTLRKNKHLLQGFFDVDSEDEPTDESTEAETDGDSNDADDNIEDK